MPTCRFAERALVCVSGRRHGCDPRRPAVRPGAVELAAAGACSTSATRSAGLRAYLAVSGGIAVPVDLGSARPSCSARFGGYAGRALAEGDLLPLGRAENLDAPLDVAAALPVLGNDWELRVLPGPHGAPEHLTGDGVEELFAATWTVDHRADRTGIRLVGPDAAVGPDDGGEAGLHPSQHPRQRLPRRRDHALRGHPGDRRPGRAEPGRLRRPGGRGRAPTGGSSASCAPATASGWCR